MVAGHTVHGCYFTGSLKWAIALHHTHGHTVRNCVVTGDGPGGLSEGAGIVTEDGSESGHVIEDNLCIGLYGLPNENRGNNPHGPDDGFYHLITYMLVALVSFLVGRYSSPSYANDEVLPLSQSMLS
jgi:hypothetical protein